DRLEPDDGARRVQSDVRRQRAIVDDELAAVADGEKLPPAEDAHIAGRAERDRPGGAGEHVGTVLDQVDAAAGAELAKPFEPFRKPEVVDDDDRAGRRVDAPLDVVEISRAVGVDLVERGLGSVSAYRLDERSAVERRDENALARRDAEHPKTVEECRAAREYIVSRRG